MTAGASVVVVGAGIAGVSAAYHLTVKQGVPDVVIVDPRPPLTLTSDKSTECYRNYWPNAPMVGLVNRSIDIFEELSEASGDAFGLTRRGYLFVTARSDELDRMMEGARVSSSLGAGPVRVHPGPEPYGPQTDGFDLLDAAMLQEQFPYITADAVGALHVRRAGWFSAQQLGAWMLDQAKEAGLRHLMDEVAAIDAVGDRVRSVSLAGGETLGTDAVVNAAGPLAPKVARMVALDLPVFAELHIKVAFKEHLGIVPRDAPMIIWSDPQRIDWTAEEREALAEEGRADLLGEMPIFCHGRPEGGPDSPYLLALWEYHGDVREPTWPIPDDPLYPEAVMRGMTTMVPELRRYLEHLPQSAVDGGYYSKTRENRPLIGPAGPDGFHLMAGMSGFGVMVSAGAGELLAAHVTGTELPGYADAFRLSRYEDPGYMAEIDMGSDSGQL